MTLDFSSDFISTAFPGYLMRNKLVPPSASIVVTDLMRTLFTRVGKFCGIRVTLDGNTATVKDVVDDASSSTVTAPSLDSVDDASSHITRHYISLEGPPGTGKTTTAYWLYHQLLHFKIATICFPAHLGAEQLSKIKGQCTTLRANPPKGVVFICDMTSIYTLSSAMIKNWDGVLQEIVKFDKTTTVMILSLSSAFHISRKYGTREIQSFLSHLYYGCSPIHFTRQEDDIMRSIYKQIKSTSSDDPVVEAKGIPLVLTTQISLVQLLKDELKAMFKSIKSDVIDYDKNRNLLLALRYCQPISVFDLHKDDVEELVPVLANLVYIEDDIPKFHVDGIENDLIDALLREIPREASLDEESVVGFIFERIICELFTDCTVQIDGENTFTLHLVPSVPRLEPGNTVLGKDVLWRLPKQTAGIDYVSVVEVNGSEVLVMIQVSVQKNNQKDKVEKVLNVTRTPWQRNENVSPPDKKYYIYVNPHITNGDFEALAQYFNAAKKNKDWKYGQVASESYNRMKSLYNQASKSAIKY